MAARNTIIRHYLPVVEIKDFDVLIGNKIFDQLPKKPNKKRLKNLSKCQETMTMQQEIF